MNKISPISTISPNFKFSFHKIDYLNFSIIYTNQYKLSGFSGLVFKYQPSGAGGTRSPPATPHRLQNLKWPPVGPKMADGVWTGQAF